MIFGIGECVDLFLDYCDVLVLVTRRFFAFRVGGVFWFAFRFAFYSFDVLVDYICLFVLGVFVGCGYRFKVDVLCRFLDFVFVCCE